MSTKTKVYGADHAKAIQTLLMERPHFVIQHSFDVHEFLHSNRDMYIFTSYFETHPVADWEAVGERAGRLIKLMMSPEQIAAKFEPDVEVDEDMPLAIYRYLLDALGAEEDIGDR